MILIIKDLLLVVSLLAGNMKILHSNYINWQNLSYRFDSADRSAFYHISFCMNAQNKYSCS